jgi:predicted O-methyltransferase YrrM
VKNRSDVIRLIQRVNRRLNAGYLETLYQSNYLELARTTPWLKDVPLASPNGGTASFSLLYTLLSVLRAGRTDRMLEFGVGQSSRVLRQYAAEHGKELVHIDDNEEWLRIATEEGPGVSAEFRPPRPMRVGGHDIEWYSGEPPEGRFDLVLVDGPVAEAEGKTYNRLGVAEWIPDVLADEFVLVVDDASRPGEQALVGLVEQRLRAAGRQAGQRHIIGANSQMLFATPAFTEFLYL